MLSLIGWIGLFTIISLGSANEYGYLASCPGATGPVEIRESVIDGAMFVILQIHEPESAQQIAYLHRRRHVMSKAAEAIGTDPEVDFKRRKTMVFLDGYIDSSHAVTVRFLQGNFAHMGYNTIAVDAQKLYALQFPVAVRVSYQIGNITAMFLNDLMRYGLRARDIELVGISLGGQVLSLVAKHFIRITGRKVGRIFAMDAGGPCFRGMPVDRHLNPTDAEMVQVIHTANDGFGMGNAQGHVDFYINGGEWQHVLNPDQPWCEDLCSHITSAFYLYMSFLIYPDKFVGIKCKNVQQAREHRCYENYPYVTNVMGLKTDRKKPGIYYIPVQAGPPFHAAEGWMETKPVYTLVNNDALSDVEHFVLAQRSLDLNLSPLERVNNVIVNMTHKH